MSDENALRPPSDRLIAPLVEAALREDLGDAGDITSALTIPAETRGRARIVAREAGRLCGLACARLAFRALDASLTVRERLPDGAETAGGALIAEIEGPARAILSAERVALNFIGQLSGIATATDALVRAVAGTKARIVCTRKTTPGLRILEKYAVRCGGGLNHRFGLYDAVLIKDNHIAAAGGVAAALGAAKAGAGHLVKIEIEVDTLAQLEEALAAGADAVLLDNMTPDQLREAVRLTAGRAVLEASGNVRADTVRAIAETGVDVISSGAITHSRRVLDIGLDWV